MTENNQQRDEKKLGLLVPFMFPDSNPPLENILKANSEIKRIWWIRIVVVIAIEIVLLEMIVHYPKYGKLHPFSPLINWIYVLALLGLLYMIHRGWMDQGKKWEPLYEPLELQIVAETFKAHLYSGEPVFVEVHYQYEKEKDNPHVRVRLKNAIEIVVNETVRTYQESSQTLPPSLWNEHLTYAIKENLDEKWELKLKIFRPRSLRITYETPAPTVDSEKA